MSRNSSGTYSAPAGNPVITGTTIASSWANGTITDIGTELTSSLDRSGRGGMLAALRLIDGIVGTPALSFTSEVNSGLYRIGPNDIGMSVNGAKVVEWNTTGLIVQGVVTATGTITGNLFAGPINSPSVSVFTGSATRAPVNLVPQAAPSTPSNGDIWVDTGNNSLSARINGATQALLSNPVARTSLPTVGQQISTNSGAFSTASGSFVDVTNLSVTITTTGRPVFVFVMPDPSVGSAYMGMTAGAGTNGFVRVERAGSSIGAWLLWVASGPSQLTSLPILDAPAAGTYTYKVRASGDGISTINVQNYRLVAYEL